MALYLKDLVDNPALLDDVWDKGKPVVSCLKCNQPTDLFYPGDVCEGCYYNGLGEIVEENPIPSGGIRRS